MMIETTVGQERAAGSAAGATDEQLIAMLVDRAALRAGQREYP